MCSSPPPPALNKPLRAAAGLFCTTPSVQVAEPKPSLAACFSGDKGGVAWGRWGAGGCFCRQHQCMIRKEPLRTQSVCRLNVRILCLQQPSPPTPRSPPQTNTGHMFRPTCFSLKGRRPSISTSCWCHLSSAACGRGGGVLLSSPPGHRSMPLSPFTFPRLGDVSLFFHFIPARCSSLINKQMTFPV